MGTMNYLPPEQLRAAREADTRSDQYGLGTILYECVTGQRAFEEDSFYIVLKKIAEGEYPRPSARRPGIPPRLEAVIMRAMSLEPLERFESVRQLGAALLEHASESSQILWAPFFGEAPAIDAPPAARPAPSQARVATMVAPPPSTPPPTAGPSSGPISGTMELPAPRKQSSTTMRNANGERQAPITFNRPQRSRAPMVVAAVVLVSAIAVLIILRGGAGTGRREDSEQSTLDPSSASRSGSPAPEPVRRETARPPLDPQAQPPVTVPGTTARTAPPARGQIATPDEDDGAAKANDRAASDGRPRRPAGKPIRKPGRAVHGKRPPAADETPAEEPERAVPLPNQAPIIPL
jgi:serine/threonine-protein kinase